MDVAALALTNSPPRAGESQPAAGAGVLFAFEMALASGSADADVVVNAQGAPRASVATGSPDLAGTPLGIKQLAKKVLKAPQLSLVATDPASSPPMSPDMAVNIATATLPAPIAATIALLEEDAVRPELKPGLASPLESMVPAALPLASGNAEQVLADPTVTPAIAHNPAPQAAPIVPNIAPISSQDTRTEPDVTQAARSASTPDVMNSSAIGVPQNSPELPAANVASQNALAVSGQAQVTPLIPNQIARTQVLASGAPPVAIPQTPDAPRQSKLNGAKATDETAKPIDRSNLASASNPVRPGLADSFGEFASVPGQSKDAARNIGDTEFAMVPSAEDAGAQTPLRPELTAANGLITNQSKPPFEAIVNVGIPSLAQPNSTAQSPQVAIALANRGAPVPFDALAVAIARNASQGHTRFELRLDPPELGRLDVTLQFDDAGGAQAHIRADRPEALELLQKDAKSLEQALRQAGVQLDQSALSFSLNQGQNQRAAERDEHGRKQKYQPAQALVELETVFVADRTDSRNGLDLTV